MAVASMQNALPLNDASEVKSPNLQRGAFRNEKVLGAVSLVNKRTASFIDVDSTPTQNPPPASGGIATGVLRVMAF